MLIVFLLKTVVQVAAADYECLNFLTRKLFHFFLCPMFYDVRLASREYWFSYQSQTYGYFYVFLLKHSFFLSQFGKWRLGFLTWHTTIAIFLIKCTLFSLDSFFVSHVHLRCTNQTVRFPLFFGTIIEESKAFEKLTDSFEFEKIDNQVCALYQERYFESHIFGRHFFIWTALD